MDRRHIWTHQGRSVSLGTQNYVPQEEEEEEEEEEEAQTHDRRGEGRSVTGALVLGGVVIINDDDGRRPLS